MICTMISGAHVRSTCSPLLILNLVYCNTMQVSTHSRGVEECVCSDIARMLEGVASTDLKVEAKQYGKVIVLQSRLGKDA